MKKKKKNQFERQQKSSALKYHEAEVDYDSEIGSKAWNIPLVIFQLQLISQAISGS